MHHPIPFSFAKEILSYNPATGEMVWLVGHRRGRKAGSVHWTGYLQIGIRHRGVPKFYLGHRVAWLLAHGEWPSGEVDHRNGDKLDNRAENLRLATHQQNMANSRRQSNNTSGATGVVRRPGGWQAYIQCNRKRISFGVHDDFELAELIAGEARRKFFGEFSPENGVHA